MKSTKVKFEKIPMDLQTRRINLKSAIEIVAQLFLEEPGYFGMASIEEDMKSSIILRLIEKGEEKLKKFSPEICSFRTFCSNMIRYENLSLIRMNKRKNELKNIYEIQAHFDYADTEEMYNGEEFAEKLVRFKPYFPTRRDKVPYRIQNTAIQICTPEVKYNSEHKKDISCYINSLTEPETRTLVVLALKSCYYLNDFQIKKISEVCNIPEEAMFNAVCEIRSSLSAKLERLEIMKKRRIHTFYLYTKYKIRINAKEYQHGKEDELKYKKHSKEWLTKISPKLKSKMQITPSNVKIGEIMGLGAKQVSYYIKFAADEKWIKKISKKVNL